MAKNALIGKLGKNSNVIATYQCICIHLAPFNYCEILYETLYFEYKSVTLDKD